MDELVCSIGQDRTAQDSTGQDILSLYVVCRLMYRATRTRSLITALVAVDDQEWFYLPWLKMHWYSYGDTLQSYFSKDEGEATLQGSVHKGQEASSFIEILHLVVQQVVNLIYRPFVALHFEWGKDCTYIGPTSSTTNTTSGFPGLWPSTEEQLIVYCTAIAGSMAAGDPVIFGIGN
eukprot:jgi/Psemu1/38455/gm1.38455_g